MTWTVWDVVVIALGVIQLVLVGAVAWVVLTIVRGPVAGVAGRAGDVVERGRAFADVGSCVVSANRAHLTAILTDIRAIASTLRAPDASASLPINYQTIRRAVVALTTFRRTVNAVRSLRLRGARSAAHGALQGQSGRRTAARRRSLVDSLGLVPPIVARIAPLLPYARAAVGVWKQMRGQAARRG